MTTRHPDLEIDLLRAFVAVAETVLLGEERAEADCVRPLVAFLTQSLSGVAAS